MQFVITSTLLALQLVSASVLPRDGLEYSELTGIEPFNTTFALEHLVEDGALEGTQSLTERQASGAVFYCINANWGPACEYRYMPKDQCGKNSSERLDCLISHLICRHETKTSNA